MWPPPVDEKQNEAWWDEFWNEVPTQGFGGPSRSILRHIENDGLGRRAIDFASGNGRYALELASRGYKTTAVELTSAGCNLIKKRCKGFDVEVIQSSARNFESMHAFALVVCSGLLEEVPVSTHEEIINKLTSITEPGGLLINRYCLEIEGRGVLIPDGFVRSLYSAKEWTYLEVKENKVLKRSKGGFNLRHGTVVSLKS